MTGSRRNRYARLGALGLAAAVGDLVLVHAGYLAAFALRFGGALPDFNFQGYLRAAPGLSVLAFVLFLAYGLYDLRPRSWRNAASGLTVAVTLLLGLGMGLGFVVRAFSLPRSVFVLAWILQLLLLLAWRNLVWNLARRFCGKERLVIVGPAREVEGYAAKLAEWGQAPYEVVGLLVGGEPGDGATAEGETPPPGAHYPRRFSPADLPLLLRGQDIAVDALVTSPSTPPEERAEVVSLAAAAGVPVLVIPSHHDLLILDSGVSQIDDTLVFEVGTGGIPPHIAWAKRLTDILVSLAGLALTLPFYPFIALAIRLTSPGPVFYRQTRVGLGGRSYTLWKFRTMRDSAEAETGAVLAERDDPRVTPVGRFLRRYRLDEVPQLCNVLGGSMSLVGPRPERPEFVREYARTVPFYGQRHLVKPGLTGLAQLSGRYDTPAEEKLRYDLLYVKRYSYLLDLRILFLTAKVLLMGEEAHWRGEAEVAAARGRPPAGGSNRPAG